MADNRRKKNNTRKADAKKPMTSGMKKIIRRSIAGVCLASAVIVAAIPADRSGKAQASITNEQKDVFDAINMLNGVAGKSTYFTNANKITDANSGLNYDDDLTKAPEVQKDAAAPDLGLAIPHQTASVSTKSSYTVANNSLRYMFDFYETTSGTSTEKAGIICSYNHDLGDTSVILMMPGEEFDPFDPGEEESEDSIRALLLRSAGEKYSYTN